METWKQLMCVFVNRTIGISYVGLVQKQKKYKIIIINKTTAFSHHFWRALSRQLGTGVVFAGALQKGKTKRKIELMMSR